MKYEELVSQIKEQFMKADVSQIKEHIAYQFNIMGEAEGAFYAEISEGTLSIEPYEYFDRDVLFTTTADTLLAIVEGKLDAVKAFTVGKLKVEGDFDKALKLQNFARKDVKKTNKAATVKKAGKEVVEKKKTVKAAK